MGEAKRRGTFEQRQTEALEKIKAKEQKPSSQSRLDSLPKRDIQNSHRPVRGLDVAVLASLLAANINILKES